MIHLVVYKCGVCIKLHHLHLHTTLCRGPPPFTHSHTYIFRFIRCLPDACQVESLSENPKTLARKDSAALIAFSVQLDRKACGVEASAAIMQVCGADVHWNELYHNGVIHALEYLLGFVGGHFWGGGLSLMGKLPQLLEGGGRNGGTAD